MKLEELFAKSERDNFVLDLTPAIAEDWLFHCNTRNRPLNDKFVNYLVDEIKAGRWQLTHQGIAFSDNQVLLDGQHRLLAVALAGMTVPVRVFINEPAESMAVLDTGRRRRNDQVLWLSAGLGEVTAKDLATLRAMFPRLQGRRRSPGEEGQLLEKYLTAIRFAQEIMKDSRKLKGLAPAEVRAVLARAWHSAESARLRHFADVLGTGRPLGEHDEPILLLFQHLIKSAGDRTRQMRRECYGKAERALLAFLREEPLARLHCATEELFPLPEETQAAA